MIESLDVMLWGEKVGTLVSSRENHRNKACFYFDPAYVSGGYDIAPLRAPIKGAAVQRGMGALEFVPPDCRAVHKKGCGYGLELRGVCPEGGCGRCVDRDDRKGNCRTGGKSGRQGYKRIVRLFLKIGLLLCVLYRRGKGKCEILSYIGVGKCEIYI